jgi:signal peptidase I
MKIIKSVIAFVADTLETITFVGSMYIVVYLFFFFPSSVMGASMEPTLHTGDRIFISRVAYRMGEISRGDVVIIKSPRNPDIEYVKRVIGLPGETLLFKDGEVYVNDYLLEEPYLTEKTNLWQNGFVEENIPYVVPENHIFVMGDNRPRSSDSREFGPVPVESIIGKATVQYYPELNMSL